MRKTYTIKTPSGNFKVTTPENPPLSKQDVTSKEIPVPYSNLQLNPYPNTNWTCSVVTISHFQCTTPSARLTNYVNPSTRLDHNLRRMLAAKFFSSSHDEDHEVAWSQNPMVYKHSNFFKNQGKLGFRSHFSSHYEIVLLCNLCHLLWPLK